MAIPSSFIDELVARSDITEIVSRYVQLKKSGANYFGVCPFHSEKTPSFSVAPDKQIFHCFGCGVGGGVINFIMRIEGLDFPDAVRYLAGIYNMTVPEDGGSEPFSKRREEILALNRDAARFFYETLLGDGGKPAREYLNKRGITKNLAVRFGLGYSQDSWDALISAMIAKGYDKSLLLSAGLAVKNNTGGMYDRFRGRLMFPIIDVRGNVIAFGGRVLDGSTPKYLNSPDTPVFNKSRNLFALSIAKKSKMGMLILAEGYMDVIALHGAGIDCAVASLGTSLTDDQARLMTRYTNKVVIAYDSDEAGRKAADRAIDIINKTGMEVRVLRIPGAKDPDEFIRSSGKEAFETLLYGSQNDIEYRLVNIQSKYNMSDDKERVSFLKEAAKMLCDVKSPVEREIYAGKAAQSAKISLEAMQNEIKKEYAQKRKRDQAKEKREIRTPAASVQPKERGMRYEDVKSAMAEESIIAAVFSDPQIFDKTDGKITSKEFSSAFLGHIWDICEKLYAEKGNLTFPMLQGHIDDGEASQLTAILTKRENETTDINVIEQYIAIIKTQYAKRQAAEDEQNTIEAFKKIQEKKRGYFGG